MRSKEVSNHSFAMFCAERGVPIPVGYRQVTPNPSAGFKSISKYDKSQPVLDDGAWALAGEWTKNHFQAAMSGSRVLSQEVVLVEMDKSTSCGYPWNLKFKDKNDFLADEKARRALEDFWTLLGLPEEEPMVPIWTCSQKCEMRTPEKILDNNLRTFTASPFEHSVNLNRMCLDMNNKFYDSANDIGGFTRTWSVVGASKFMGGWDQLFRRLDVHPNAFELDESAFDSSLFAQAMFGQMEIRWSFLREQDRTPANRLRMERLYASIVHSVIVLENGELIQKHTGNPSGSSNTIVDNTMALFRLFAYAWIVLCKKQQRATSYEEFMARVEAALCGDDNTFTVDDEVVDWFNPSTIAPVWSGIGVTTKTPCEESRPLSEVQFLSQGFAFSDELGIWMPVPETERVLSSLMYGSEVDDVRWHYLRACALRMDSYGNWECRTILKAYLEYLGAEYRKELIGSVERPKGAITMETIKSNWKSDAWIEGLYCGRESKERVDGVIHDTSFKNFYQQLQETLQCKSTLEESNMASPAAKARRAHKRKAKQQAYAQSKGAKKAPRKQKQKKKRNQLRGPSAGNARKGYSGSGMVPRAGHTVTATNRVSQYLIEDEFIEDINGSILFQVRQWEVNPGQYPTFPWMSTIAQRYEEYEFEELEFYVTSTVSGFAPNGQQGTIVLSASYDAADPLPGTLRAVEDSDPHTVPCLPCTPVVSLKLDCNLMRKNIAKFVRPGPLVANQDIKTFDCANLYVSTSGCANTTKIGELHVRYKCRVKKPILDVNAEGIGFHARGIVPVGSNLTMENWTVANGGSDSLDVGLSGNTITFGADQVGTYFVCFSISNGNGTTTPFTTGVLAGNIQSVTYFGASMLPDQVSTTASNGTLSVGNQNQILCRTVRVTSAAAGSTWGVGPPTVGLSASYCDLFIFKLPSSLLGVGEVLSLDEEDKEIKHLKRCNDELEERLARIERSLMQPGAAMELAEPAIESRDLGKKRSREESKYDDEESPVYVSARGGLKVRT
jgi:hypothetical protein